MDRRGFLTSLLALAAAPAGAAGLMSGPPVISVTPFSLEALHERANRLASRPYSARAEVPKGWRGLSYDQYRSIWFRHDRALWNGTSTPYRVDFFHPGLYFPRAVQINVVEGGQAHRLGFDFSQFDTTDKVPDLPQDETMGYSGLRLRTEFDQPGIHEEFMVLQGASYFRAIGKGQTYGLSARGLALGTGSREGEEFPDFTEFWLERPDPDAERIVLHALMDSPSTTGVYSFNVQPGRPTRVDVQAALYPRKPLDNVGIAPLTSMFLYDSTNRHRFEDFRPAVHDNDGLLVQNGAGETLWRPLANPTRLQISSFVDDGPKGFGLMQRARKFSDFNDLEALYHNRPGLWIEPAEDWGAGAVTLVEIPADKEIYDNIVAYWRPREPLEAGQEHRLSYRMYWGDEPAQPAPVARVLNTAIGRGFQGQLLAAIDFADHPAIPRDLEQVTRFTGINRGSATKGVLQRNPETDGPRLVFSFDPGSARAVELRAQLRHKGTNISEVWLYRWSAA